MRKILILLSFLCPNPAYKIITVGFINQRVTCNFKLGNYELISLPAPVFIKYVVIS